MQSIQALPSLKSQLKIKSVEQKNEDHEEQEEALV